MQSGGQVQVEDTLNRQVQNWEMGRNNPFQNFQLWRSRLAQLLKHATLGLRVVSSSLILNIEITLKQQQKVLKKNKQSTIHVKGDV